MSGRIFLNGNGQIASNRRLPRFSSGPFILQKFFKGRLVQQPFYDPATNSIETLVGRVRLCALLFCFVG